MEIEEVEVQLVLFSSMIERVSEQSFSELSSSLLARVSPKPLSGINISMNIKRIKRTFS